MPTLAILFCAIMSDMRTALGVFISRRDPSPPVVWLGTRALVPVQARPATTPIPMATLTLAHTRLGRLAERFARLYRRWMSNTLPRLRPSRAGQTRPDPTQPEPTPTKRRERPTFPRRHAWLAGVTDHHVRAHASQLSHLLARPEAQEFLHAVPRAGRLLRPLCHMLGIAVPPPIVRPVKPRAPRLRPPKAPNHDRPLPPYVRLAARAWKKKYG